MVNITLIIYILIGSIIKFLKNINTLLITTSSNCHLLLSPSSLNHSSTPYNLLNSANFYISKIPNPIHSPFSFFIIFFYKKKNFTRPLPSKFSNFEISVLTHILHDCYLSLSSHFSLLNPT